MLDKLLPEFSPQLFMIPSQIYDHAIIYAKDYKG